MKIYKESWMFTDASREALLSEIVKIGQNAGPPTPPKKKYPIKSLAKAMAAAGLGSAAGHASGELFKKYYPYVFSNKMTSKHQKILKFLAPIAGGGAALAGMVASEIAKRKAEEEY